MSRWVGYHAGYFALRVLRYLVRAPFGVGALALLHGYLTAGPGPFDAQLRADMRAEQAQKLQDLRRHPWTFLRATYSRRGGEQPPG